MLGIEALFDDPFDRVCSVVQQPSDSGPNHGRSIIWPGSHSLFGILSIAPGAINANATPTFGIFATASDGVPLVPKTNRIFAEFSGANGVVRGSTSVAVETE